MSRLLTINDLKDPNNDWKPLLSYVTWLGEALEAWKAVDTGHNRVLTIPFGDDTKRSPGLHASELVTCTRQATYATRGEERVIRTTNGNMKMRFQLGTMVHSLVQSDLHIVCGTTKGQEVEVAFEDEVKIKPDMGGVAEQYGISSSSDGLFTFSTKGEPFLRVGLEIKTASKDEYEKTTKPMSKHLDQGALYQKCLDVPLMWYLYYNKSNSNWTRSTAPWVVPFEDNTWRKMEDRAKTVQLNVLNSTLPEREEGMHCSWCPFSQVCNPSVLKLQNPYAKPASPRRFK